MHDALAQVVENRDLGSGVFLLRLLAPEVAEGCLPGCFAMLQTAEGLTPIARRPFSIQRASDGICDILYRVVGEGTALMSRMTPGQEARLLGPLGRSFRLPEEGERAILLGGGVGIPPMVALADALESKAHRAWAAFLGVASVADRGCMVGFDERYGEDPRVHRATMDGTLGFHGHVVAAFERWLDRSEAQGPLRLYACGPMVMLRAVAAAAHERGLPAQVSVETLMGCGVGVCMACGSERREGEDPERRAQMSPYDRWLLTCRKGPVFDAQAVVLDDEGFLH